MVDMHEVIGLSNVLELARGTEINKSMKDRLVRKFIQSLGYNLYMSNDVTYSDTDDMFEYTLNSDGEPIVAVRSLSFGVDMNFGQITLNALVNSIKIDTIRALILTNGIDLLFIDRAGVAYDLIHLDKLTYTELDRLSKYTKERIGKKEFIEEAKQTLFNRQVKNFVSGLATSDSCKECLLESIKKELGCKSITEKGSDNTLARVLRDALKAVSNVVDAYECGCEQTESAKRTYETELLKSKDFITWKDAKEKFISGIKKCPFMKMVVLGHVYDLEDCNTYGRIIINILLNLKEVGKLTRENLKDSKLGHLKYGFNDSPDGMRTAKYVEELNLYFDSTMTGDTFVRIINYLISEYSIGERGILVKFA